MPPGVAERRAGGRYTPPLQFGLRLSEVGVLEDVDDDGVPGQESIDTDMDAAALAGDGGEGESPSAGSCTETCGLLREASGKEDAPSASSR